jgi:hypothetical protein
MGGRHASARVSGRTITPFLRPTTNCPRSRTVETTPADGVSVIGE